MTVIVCVRVVCMLFLERQIIQLKELKHQYLKENVVKLQQSFVDFLLASTLMFAPFYIV